MAIARKIDPAALARAFADEVSVIPEVKRVWYRVRPGWFDPERLSLSFAIQYSAQTATAERAVMAALTRIQEQYWDDLTVGSFEFSLAEDDDLTLDDLVSPDATELPLRES
jgi:hypothetical protein